MIDPIAVLSFRSELDSAIERAVDQLALIGLAVLSAVVVIALARFTIKLVQRFAWSRMRASRIDPAAATLVNNGISIVVYFIAITLILALWGASWSTLLTAISISTLAVVLGLQDLLKSLLGGAFVTLDQSYQVGERIQIGDALGEVIEVRLRTTVLRSDDGKWVSLPNSLILSSPLINLDRPVTSATVVSVSGVVGQPSEVRVAIEKALEEEPPVIARVAVSEDIQRSFRDGLTGMLRRRSSAPETETLESVPLRVNVFLTPANDSPEAEKAIIERCATLFPGSTATIRRSAAV